METSIGTTLVAALAFLVWAMAVWLHGRVTIFAGRHFRSGPPPAKQFPPISILKPLKGTYPALAENLESFFTLDYPDYELIFAVASPHDPALPLVRSIMAQYPTVKAQWVISPEGKTGNPKFSTLLLPFENAVNDLLLISDGNVRARPDYLRRWVRYLDPSVGIVAGLPVGTQPEGIGGHLDTVFLNSFYARGTLLCFLIQRPVTSGKSQLFFRSVARKFGGLKEVGRHLGADVLLGKAFNRLGLKTVLAIEPVEQVNGRTSFATFWRRHLRWARVRKKLKLTLFFLELPMTSVGSAAAGALALCLVHQPQWQIFAAGHFLFWYGTDYWLMRKLHPAQKWLPTTAAWIGRELLGLPLWFHALCGNQAEWAGKTLTLGQNAEIEKK